MSNIPNNAEFDADAMLAAIKADIEAIGDGQSLPPASPKPPPKATSPSDLERLNATTEKLYTDKRRELLALESRHSRERAELSDSYRMSLAELEHEAREALRTFDRSFESVHAPLAELVMRLAEMRE